MVYALLGIRYNYPKSIDFGRSDIEKRLIQSKLLWF